MRTKSVRVFHTRTDCPTNCFQSDGKRSLAVEYENETIKVPSCPTARTIRVRFHWFQLGLLQQITIELRAETSEQITNYNFHECRSMSKSVSFARWLTKTDFTVVRDRFKALAAKCTETIRNSNRTAIDPGDGESSLLDRDIVHELPLNFSIHFNSIFTLLLNMHNSFILKY